jgi:hypothetical protein
MFCEVIHESVNQALVTTVLKFGVICVYGQADPARLDVKLQLSIFLDSRLEGDLTTWFH